MARSRMPTLVSSGPHACRRCCRVLGRGNTTTCRAGSATRACCGRPSLRSTRQGGASLPADGGSATASHRVELVRLSHDLRARYTRIMFTTEPAVEDAGPGLFRVPGFSGEEIRAALRLFGAASTLRGEEADQHRGALLRAMITSGFDPVPHATVEQARRIARHRAQLLASGAHTMRSLQELRGDASGSATRTWVSRRRADHSLFTVDHDGVTLLPAFELASDGSPRVGLGASLRVLAGAGLGGWELWTWFVSATPWLGGRSPESLMDADEAAVVRAASSFVSNLE